MVGNLESLVVKIQADVSGLRVAMDGANQKLNAFGSLATSTGKIAAGAFASIGFAAANMATSALASIPRIADSMTLLKARLEVATGSAQAAEAAFNALVRISNSTGQAVADLSSLYNKFALANQTLGLSQSELLRITETFAKTLTIAGASTAEANSAILQFGQAMGAGVLRGEELNALMESNSYFAIKLAESLGVPVGELRKMGEQGKLTSDLIVQAMRDMQAEVDATAAKIPMTLGRQMQELSNTFSIAVSDINEATGAINGLIKLVQVLSQSLQGLAFLAKAAFDPFKTLGTGEKIGNLIGRPAQQSFPVSSSLPQGLQQSIAPIGGGFTPFNPDAAPKIKEVVATVKKASASISGGQGSLRKATQEARESMDGLKVSTEAFGNGLVTAEEPMAHINDFLEANKKKAEDVKQGMRELGMSFTSAFEDAITKGGDLRDVMQGLYQDIARIITRKAITEPLAEAATGILGSFDFGSIFSGLFGRAGGGQVSAGRAYMVGEHGKEMFVPSSDGRIMTAQQTKNLSGASPTIYQSFNIQTGIEGVARAEILKAAPALMAQAKEATLAAIRRGGSAAQTVGLRA